MTKREKSLQNAILTELENGLSLREIAKLCTMKRRGQPIIKPGVLGKIAKGIMPKDKLIRYALGIDEPRLIKDRTTSELLWCLKNRQPHSFHL